MNMPNAAGRGPGVLRDSDAPTPVRVLKSREIRNGRWWLSTSPFGLNMGCPYLVSARGEPAQQPHGREGGVGAGRIGAAYCGMAFAQALQ